jgi:hypothetical protein
MSSAARLALASLTYIPNQFPPLLIPRPTRVGYQPGQLHASALRIRGFNYKAWPAASLDDFEQAHITAVVENSPVLLGFVDEVPRLDWFSGCPHWSLSQSTKVSFRRHSNQLLP